MKMMLLKTIPAVLTAMLSFAALAGGTTVASAAAPAASTCDGGTIAAGRYQSLTVTGDCSLPDTGTVTINGSLALEAGATLNGITPATLIVRGNVYVGQGAALALGCSPEVGCDVTTQDQINGSLIADQPLAMILHSDIIRGNLSIQGGGGGVTCDPLLLGGPAYTTVEDSQINGSVTITGLESCWLGFFRNHVNGNVTISNNMLADPDATEVATNQIRGNLSCSGNSPAAQVGDSEGAPNSVNGRKLGECASL